MTLGPEPRNALVCWFTGLSGAGKSSVAEETRRRLVANGLAVLILDGDWVREKMHRHLGFSRSEIAENNRLIAEYCAKNRDRHDVILVPIISPYESSRQNARNLLMPNFHVIYCAADLGVVAKRDTKGLYEKAARGDIDNLIGFSPKSPYEPPPAPDLRLDTGSASLKSAVDSLVGYIHAHMGNAAEDVK